MSDSAPRPRPFGRGTRTAAVIFAAVVGFLAYAWLLLFHASFSVGGSDSSGYANTARLLTTGRIVAPVDALGELDLPNDFVRVFIPLGFEPGPRPGTTVPYYPPGFPLQLAFAGLIAGWNYGPFVLSPLSALLSLLLFYLVARELGFSRLFSTAGAAVLGLYPTFVFQGEQPMSDISATLWSLATILFALRSRRRDVWAIAAGAALGMAVLVRPTNVLLVIPLVFALALRLRSWLFFAAGAIPFAAMNAGWNFVAYRDPFKTGYSGELAGSLALSNFAERFRHYGLWLSKLFTPLVPAGWLLLWADRRAAARDRGLLFSWFGVFLLLYCFWGPYEAWWYTRYLLPGTPPLILGALLVVRDGLHVTKKDRAAALRRVAAVVALGAVLAVEWRWIRKNGVLEFGEGEKLYPEACHWTERTARPGSLVVSMQMSGALHYYTDLPYAMWNWMDAHRFAVLRVSTESRGFRWYSLLAPFEVPEVDKIAPGAEWREIGRVEDVSLRELRTAAPR